MDRISLFIIFLLLILMGQPVGVGRREVVNFKGYSTGGNAKPTFGILNVIPGRDLFSS